jgi:hypothetical protein
MSKILVKFYKPKRWAEHLPTLPQFEITEPGQELEISSELAKIVVGTKQGEYVLPKEKPKTPEELKKEMEEKAAADKQRDDFEKSAKNKKEKADKEMREAMELANQQAKSKGKGAK